MVAWLLAIMIALQPVAPWRDTYEKSAMAIAQAAVEQSVKGDDNGSYTAVILVSLAWWESRFNPEAHNAKDPGGGSFGLFQASRVAIPNIFAQARQAAAKVNQSFIGCSKLPLDKRLSHYTTGGPVCFPTRESTHRMNFAMKLLKEHPYQ